MGSRSLHLNDTADGRPNDSLGVITSYVQIQSALKWSHVKLGEALQMAVQGGQTLGAPGRGLPSVRLLHGAPICFLSPQPILASELGIQSIVQFGE